MHDSGHSLTSVSLRKHCLGTIVTSGTYEGSHQLPLVSFISASFVRMKRETLVCASCFLMTSVASCSWNLLSASGPPGCFCRYWVTSYLCSSNIITVLSSESVIIERVARDIRSDTSGNYSGVLKSQTLLQTPYHGDYVGWNSPLMIDSLCSDCGERFFSPGKSRSKQNLSQDGNEKRAQPTHSLRATGGEVSIRDCSFREPVSVDKQVIEFQREIRISKRS